MAERKQKEEPQDAQKAAAEAVRNTDPPESADEYPVERLIEDGALLVGYAPHEVAGALSGVNRKNLTVEEAKAATKKWLAAPVKED